MSIGGQLDTPTHKPGTFRPGEKRVVPLSESQCYA